MVMYSCIFMYECVFYYVLGQRWPNKQVKSNQSVFTESTIHGNQEISVQNYFR